MAHAVEFVDENGRLPFDRDFLPTYQDEKKEEDYF
jgi:hypothetical protein